jgi:two-component system sensor histidine kinase KdpD
MTARRPDPDALLARLKTEETRARRGKLKVFFGANPGVGKTFAMLEEARARRGEGIDVVVGVVETHGRKETEALVAGLEVLPRKPVEYRGVHLQEFDLDAALHRAPGILLVDELAHTNAPGSRHLKRWQDVDELLAAGVSIYTTLNVQHLESLNDIVAQITGTLVRETVPDAVFDGADEVELADLTPDDLLQRMIQGKVYGAEQAGRAQEGFFRKGNLIALRELALRRVAERVDAQMRGYRQEQGIQEIWPTGDRLLVCIGPNPAGARLLRSGHRMATRLHCEWVALHIENPARGLSPDEREMLVDNLRLAEELGALTVTGQGQEPADEILAYAREHNISRIIVGKPTHPRWRDLLGRGSTLDRLVRGSGDVDVYVMTGEVEATAARRRPELRRTSPTAEYGYAALVVAVCTLISWLLFRHTTVTDIAMLYLLGSVVIASRCGRGPSLVGAVASIALFDFFFVPPALTFAVSDLQFLSTFGVMLVIALVISGFTVRIREQGAFARERESRTAALYAMSRELAAVDTREELLEVAGSHIGDAFGATAQILLPDPSGQVIPAAGRVLAYPMDEKERSVAQWTFRQGQLAGLGTDTLPAAIALYLPLQGSERVVGVLGIRPSDPARFQDPAQRQLLEAFAAQVALVLERAALTEQSRRSQLEIEAERLRTALLSSLSHDLRTPLAGITGAASSLLQDIEGMRPEVRRDLLQTVVEESKRMNRLIGNLLDMIRVETQTLVVQRDWQPLEEPIGVALIRLDDALQGRVVRVDLPADLPLVPIDGLLIEQVIINLLENALKYTPAGTPIEISARAGDGVVSVAVADRGPGLPPGEEGRIFEKFYRAPDPTPTAGVGLGLTICRGIVQAHGGRIWAENRPDGGAVFRFTLPMIGAPPTLPPREVEAAA